MCVLFVGLCLVSVFWSKDKPCWFCICKCVFCVCVCLFCGIKLHTIKPPLCFEFGACVSPLPAPVFERARFWKGGERSVFGFKIILLGGRKTKSQCLGLLSQALPRVGNVWRLRTRRAPPRPGETCQQQEKGSKSLSTLDSNHEMVRVLLVSCDLTTTNKHKFPILLSRAHSGDPPRFVCLCVCVFCLFVCVCVCVFVLCLHTPSAGRRTLGNPTQASSNVSAACSLLLLFVVCFFSVGRREPNNRIRGEEDTTRRGPHPFVSFLSTYTQSQLLP
jgi:hypothetical protein